MSETFSLEWWQITIAGLSTLAIFSFLIRENPFYRIFEHLFMGIATAFGIIATFRYFLLPKVIDPLFGLDLVVFPDGTAPTTYDTTNLLFLIPMFVGSLYYFMLSQKLNWIARIVLGFQLGIGGGTAFRAVLNEMLPQIENSFRPLYIPGDTQGSLSNLVFMTILVCSMSYFFFTFKTSERGPVARSAALGRYLMMCCFGAFFGSTIMARMALLVERLEFLINKFAPNISTLWL